MGQTEELSATSSTEYIWTVFVLFTWWPMFSILVFRAPMIPYPLNRIMASNHNAMMVDSDLSQKSEECCLCFTVN